MPDSKLFDVPAEVLLPSSWSDQPSSKRLMIFSGRSNEDLAQRISDRLGVGLGQVTLKTFANGEIYARFEESVRTRSPMTVRCLVRPS